MAKAVDIPAKTKRFIHKRDELCKRCGGMATDIHHRMRRREGGHGVQNLIGLCRGCHNWVHAHPTVATAEGYIVRTHVQDIPGAPLLVWAATRGLAYWARLNEGITPTPITKTEVTEWMEAN